jgi:hypothetical protein
VPHHPSHLRRALFAVGAAALLALPLAACSSNGSDEEATSTTSVQAAYCGAWDDVVDAFAAFDELDLVGEGLGSVRTYLDDLGESLQTFGDAADAKLGPQVEDLRSSITALGDALAGDADTDLGDAAADLRTSWDALVTALREDCPESGAGS